MRIVGTRGFESSVGSDSSSGGSSGGGYSGVGTSGDGGTSGSHLASSTLKLPSSSKYWDQARL
jgi:hypothetical protein